MFNSIIQFILHNWDFDVYIGLPIVLGVLLRPIFNHVIPAILDELVNMVDSFFDSFRR